MAAPDGLTLRRHRDLEGRGKRPYARWLLLGVLAFFLVLGLANVFGQHPVRASAAAPAAELELSAPRALRSGLYYQVRFRIEAITELEDATIVLHPDWLDGMTLNTLEPSPIGEASRDGRIALELGRIPTGDEHIFFLQFQVNPTTTGRRSQNVQLYDGEELVTSIERRITVWP